MKAFVVLCVLVGSGLTNGQQVCTSGVCGCCLIDRQLQRDEDNFQDLYNRMSADLSDITETLKVERSIFSATLKSNQDCSDPATSDFDTTIIYNDVGVNLGEDYDGSTGEYTVPWNGVYSFSVSLYNPGRYHSCAALVVDGIQEYVLMENNTDDTQDSASFFKSFALNAGQKVKVIQPAGCYLCAQNNRFNTFTGFLMYETA